MDNKVGEKIKATRKEQNMTQADLAGEEMTKSMLSQIENNVSNPSIKTLQYIADKLNKPIGYFLNSHVDKNTIINEATELNKKSEERIRHISELIDIGKIDEAQKSIEEIMENGTLDGSAREYADILFKIGKALIKINRIDSGRKYLSLSIDKYINKKFYIEAAKAYVEYANGYYKEFNYEECLKICKKAFELYYKNLNTDPLFEIELYYYNIIILSAMGDIKNAILLINQALSLSAKTSLYYKTDELYRLNAIFSYLKRDMESYESNMDKALQFASVTEDKMCLARMYAIKAIVALESNEADNALEYAEKNKFYSGKELYVYFFIKGKAYYSLGKYDLAYENIKKVDFPSYETHKFDYLNMWSSKVYEGLILNKLQKQEEALEAIKIGIEKMQTFGDTKFLADAYRSLGEVYSSMNDFKNAYLCLKKVDEIQEYIRHSDNIFF